MNIKILKNLITHPKKFFLTDEWKQLPSWIKFPAIYIYIRELHANLSLINNFLGT